MKKAYNETNPFIVSVKSSFVPLSKKKKKTREAAFVDDGEVFGKEVDTSDSDFFWHDGAVFLKLFSTTYNLRLLMGLSKPALRMFFFICTLLKPRSDRVRLFQDEYAVFSGIYASQQFFKAKKELVKLGVIAPQKGDMYFINPSIFYNGSRIGMMSGYSAKEHYGRLNG